MRWQWPLILLLLAPVLVLVSLYLPWQEASCASGAGLSVSGSGASATLPDLFDCSLSHINGWSSVGDVAALASLLLAVLASAAFVWPTTRARLSLEQGALALAYFTIAVAAQTRLEGRQSSFVGQASGETAGGHFHLAYGTYVGLAAAAFAVLGGVAAAGETLRARPPLRRMLGIVFAGGLLVALLLPWQRVGPPRSGHLSELGVVNAPGVVAAVLAIRLLVVCWKRGTTGRFEQTGLALASLLFVGAAVTPRVEVAHAYGAWVGLAAAVALTLVSLADRSLLRTIKPVPLYPAAAAIAGIVLLVSLFLPWQTDCYGHTADLKALGLSGRCVSSNGFGLVGSAAAVVAIALVVVMLVPAIRFLATLELAIAVGLLVATLGFQLETGTQFGGRLGFGYGSFVGFVAAAALVTLPFVRSRPPALDLNAVVPTVLPIILALAYVAVVFVPWWRVLPVEVWSTFLPRYADISWLTLAGGLLGVRVLQLWIHEARDVSTHARELVGLSLTMVVLAVLDSTPLPTVQLTWNSGVLLGLTVPLTLLAARRERGGLRNIRIPEILRVDRI